jgi:hypothetical protein
MYSDGCAQEAAFPKEFGISEVIFPAINGRVAGMEQRMWMRFDGPGLSDP